MTVGDESSSKVEMEDSLRAEDADLGQKLQDRQTRLWLMPLLLGTGLGLAIAFGGMGILSHRPTSQQNAIAKPPAKLKPSMTVTVATVETASVARTLNTTGTVAASDLIPVLPQTNGLQIKKFLRISKKALSSTKGMFWQF